MTCAQLRHNWHKLKGVSREIKGHKPKGKNTTKEKRQSALQQKKKTGKQILPFVTTYHPSVRNLKNILMQNWNLIQNQPLLKNIFKDPPIISYKRGQSLKDMLVRAKI